MSVVIVSTNMRRRTCVACGEPTRNDYVTSFTRVLEKQAEWVSALANGDEAYADSLKQNLASGRKYLCLDHFARSQLINRKYGEGLEVMRNSVPIAYKNTVFVRHSFPEMAPEECSSSSSSLPTSEKRPRMSSVLAGKGSELDPASMSFLMDTVKQCVKKAMLESNGTIPKKD